MTNVWCVWTESGEYESYSRDLRGVFATEELAQRHAAQIGDAEVVSLPVLDALPTLVPYVHWSAHVFPDGSVDRHNGYNHGRQCDTWSNQIAPLEDGRIVEWSGRGIPDLYVEVTGSDPALVEAEYTRLLGEARRQLEAMQSV